MCELRCPGTLVARSGGYDVARSSRRGPPRALITDEPQTTDAAASSGGRASGTSAWGGWLRLGAIGLSFLVIGFVGGWIVRGDQGPTTVLAPPDEQEQAAITSASEPSGATTAEAAPDETAPPPRDEIVLAILNGGDVAGLAANTADQAEELGYIDVEAGNAPAQTAPTTVYHVAGQLPAAERVANDLQIGPIEQLPSSGELADAVPDGARVVVVLGS